jgi:Fe2+ transport system protein B
MSANEDQLKTMEQQQKTQQQINALLEQSYQSLTCGPSCQKLKKRDELKQKYLDAKTTLQTAPHDLEESQKNYYVYAKGEAAYDRLKEKEWKEQAKQMAEQLSHLFQKELTNAETMNSYLKIAVTNSQNSTDLLQQYSSQNKEIIMALRESQTDIITNDRKTYYETEAIDLLSQWYMVFWFGFYIMLFIVIMTFAMRETLGKAVAVAVVFVMYPYYIHWVWHYIHSFWMRLINRLPANVYHNL